MNKDQIKKNLWYRVRLRPKARSVLRFKDIPQRDDVWSVTNVKKNGVVEISNISTGHVASIGSDHIHHFDSDPMSETDGYKHGFLNLTVQVFMSGCHLWVEPLPIHKRKWLIG